MQNLVRTTYRTLLKNARKIDRSTSLRSLLAAHPSRTYHPHLQQFVPLDRNDEEGTLTSPFIDNEIRALNHGSDWYVPLPLSSKLLTVEGRVKEMYRSAALTSENIKNAFEGVKHITSVIEVEQELDPMGEDQKSLEEAAPMIQSWNAKGLKFSACGNALPYDQPPSSSSTTTTDNSSSTDGVEGANQGETASPAAAPAAAAAAPPVVRLLIANPLMPHFFRHTVILLVQFNSEGAVGITINQPLVNNERVLHSLWALTSSREPILEKLSQHPVMIGGPVPYENENEMSVMLLHPFADISGGKEVSPGLFLGGSWEELNAALDSEKVKAEDVVVTAGNCLWGKGQLEGELQSGSWLCATVEGEACARILATGTSKTLIDAGLKEVQQPMVTWMATLQACGPPFDHMAPLTKHHISLLRKD